MSKIWMITGAGRGLGRSIAEAVLAAGDAVVATARNPDTLAGLKAKYGDKVLPTRLDVTDAASARAAADAAIAAFGRIDVLVNNAGVGFIGAFEEMTEAEFTLQIDTNFYGVVNTCRAIIPVMRQQRAGHIINVSTIGGRRAGPGLSGYHAAKFAVEGLSESIAQELAPLGVKLTIVEPGGFRTDWGGASMGFAQPIEGYDNVRSFGTMIQSYSGKEEGDPDRAAQVIRQLVDMDQPPLRLPLGVGAVTLIGDSYRSNLATLEQWAELSRSTNFPENSAYVPKHESLVLKD